MNKFLLWFRLLVGNQLCVFMSASSMVISFAVPIIWVFTFIPVCRILNPVGYWATLGALACYSAICFVTWLCWFLSSLFLNWAALIPGIGCIYDPEQKYMSDADKEKREAMLHAGWLASMSNPTTTSPEHDEYIKFMDNRVKCSIN